MDNLIEQETKASNWKVLLEGLKEYVTEIAEYDVFVDDGEAGLEASAYDEDDVNYKGGFSDLCEETQKRLIEEAKVKAEERINDFLVIECLLQRMLIKAIKE